MSATNSDPRVQSSELGALLRSWRETRGVSQLDLSLDAGISQRQISFIESGRSVPGRQTLLNIAQSLDVPLSERNALLLSSGYAPIYPEAAWNAQEMSSVTNVLRRMLRQQEPFPAVIMDRYWNVLMANQAFDRFFDVQACTEPRKCRRLNVRPTTHVSSGLWPNPVALASRFGSQRLRANASATAFYAGLCLPTF